MDELLAKLRESLMGADREGALGAVQALLDQNADPTVILQQGMASAMLELGARWNAGEVFLPEVVAAAEVFKQCNDLVEPALLASGKKEAASRVVMATVKGDLHDLGKNMVGAMMKTAGFEVHDLGKDIPIDRIVEAVKEIDPVIVGLSALLTTTVPEQRGVIQALEAAGLRDRVKVMVGGAPVTAEWAKEIGADGFAPNAPEAVKLARQLAGID
jgi:corrinoid protein of di/trimethylamine methyltransferase